MTPQVLIAGGGPVGLALGVDLGLRGVSCTLVEPRVESHRIPKGQNLSQRTLENFYFWGLADQLRAARVIPPEFPGNFITAYGNLMSDYWYSPATRAVADDYYFQRGDRLPQYLTERILSDRLDGLPSVHVQRGWAVAKIHQGPDNVTAEIVEQNGNGRQTLCADYAAGCDGSRSLVRSQIGLASVGTDYEQTMVLAVFRSKALHQALDRFPPAFVFRVVHKDLKGFWRFFGRVDDQGHWFFHAPVPTKSDRNETGIRRLLWDAAGLAFPCSFDHIGYWDMRVSIAQQFRVGRVFLAGDAAHSHPPYGGYGLNTGLDDVVNLAWKLEAVMQGWGGEGLLQSYDGERRPVAMETSEYFINRRIADDSEFFARHNPESDPAGFAGMWETHRSSSRERVLDYAPHYEGSPVIAGGPGGPSGARGAHSFQARPGHHLPPWTLSSGRSVFQALGVGLTLIALEDDRVAEPAPFLDAADQLAIPVHVVRDRQPPDRKQPRFILVRPDRHVAWSGNRIPADTQGLLQRVTGRLS